MERKALLVTGLALIAAAVLGVSITWAVDFYAGTWGREDSRWATMPHHGGYGWMDHDRMMGWYGSSGGPTAGAPEVTVHAGEFRFEPSRLSVTVNQPVNLTLVNDDDIGHDLVIPALGVVIDAGPGETATAGFTPERVGKFDFWCSVQGHAAAGMSGTIEVTP